MPIQKLITVKAGDYGTTYHPINGLDGAHNRPIDQHRLKVYGKTLEAFTTSSVILVGCNGREYVADGQHRIAAISRYADKSYQLPATIWTLEEIHRKGMTLAEFISGLNRGKAFTGADHISVYQHQSPWPAVFAEAGLAPAYNTSRVHMNWNNVIKAKILADYCRDQARIVGGMGHKTKPELLALEWTTADAEGIARFAKAMAWWQPIALAAQQRAKVGTLYSAPVLALAALVYEQNQGSPAMSDVAERVVAYPALPSLKTMLGNPVALAYELMRALNYRQTRHVLALYGETGRTGQASA